MTKRMFAVFVPLLLSGVSWSADKNGNKVVMADVTERGRALYEYDEAAWHATDAVKATKPSEESVGRYIGRKTDTGWEVVFGHLNATGDRFLVAYKASQGAKPQ